MYGTILIELEKFVVTRLGAEGWTALRKAAGIRDDRVYDADASYPDEEMGALVTTASRLSGTPATALLEDFGEFVAPDFLEMYASAIQPEWRTLDVIEHTESTIHAAVRLDHRGSAPPYLHATRTGPNTVVVTYVSPRRLCSMAKGISRGIARHYGEQVDIRDERCMHRGDGECRIVIEKMGRTA